MNIKQISVFLENKPGQIAEITKLLCDGGIDLKAINVAETSDYGIVRLITDNSDKSVEILNSNEYITKITEVVAVSVPNKPGGLYDFLEIVSKENVNVEYMYSIFGSADNQAYMIIKVDDTENLEAIIKQHGLKSADICDLGLC